MPAKIDIFKRLSELNEPYDSRKHLDIQELLVDHELSLISDDGLNLISTLPDLQIRNDVWRLAKKMNLKVNIVLNVDVYGLSDSVGSTSWTLINLFKTFVNVSFLRLSIDTICERDKIKLLFFNYIKMSKNDKFNEFLSYNSIEYIITGIEVLPKEIPQHEREFNIAHELCHIKNWHSTKTYSLIDTFSFLSSITYINQKLFSHSKSISNTLISPKNPFSDLVTGLIMGLPSYALSHVINKILLIIYMRSIEEPRADKQAVELLETADGAISSFERDIELFKRSKLNSSSWRARLITPNGNSLSDFKHPLTTTRLYNMKKLKQKMLDESDNSLANETKPSNSFCSII